jgi:hypothetical protein
MSTVVIGIIVLFALGTAISFAITYAGEQLAQKFNYPSKGETPWIN